ncbi:MAG: hypothetical protein V3V48_04465, partial [Candidatus Aminicenantaceae bacterium]
LQVLKKPTRLIATEGMINRQVWADRQTDPSGSISPDGRYLSFIDWIRGDLYVRDLTTGINRNLTKNPPGSLDFVHFAKWSPDGKKIAYLWYYGTLCDLRIIGLDESEPRVVFHDKDVKRIAPGGWSPDGKYISAYLEDKNKQVQKIALISVKNGDVRVLKSVKSMRPEMGPFSTDGRFIVYNYPQQEGSSERDIYLLASDGNGEIPFVEHQADDCFLGWSPDGNWLLYLSDRSGTNDAWMIRVENGSPKGAPKLIKPEIGDILPLGLTNEGVFYYNLRKRNRDPYIVDFDPQALELISEPKRINQRFVGSGRSLDWSPDGKYLAYLSLRLSLPMESSFLTLVLRSLETGEERDLNLDGSLDYPAFFPRWFPDNRSLLVLGRDHNRNEGFFKIDTQTTEVNPLFFSQPHERFFFPSISPDGKAVYYSSVTWSNNLYRIMRKELDTGEEKVLNKTLRPRRKFAPALSPDGRKIVFQLIEGETSSASSNLDILQIMPIDGGPPVEVMREQVPRGNNISSGSGLAWTPDGSHIIFSRRNGDKNRTMDLWILPSTGGKPKKLGLNVIGIQYICIHPDGKQIGFIAGKSIDEIWMLENFLPKK